MQFVIGNVTLNVNHYKNIINYRRNHYMKYTTIVNTIPMTYEYDDMKTAPENLENMFSKFEPFNVRFHDVLANQPDFSGNSNNTTELTDYLSNKLNSLDTSMPSALASVKTTIGSKSYELNPKITSKTISAWIIGDKQPEIQESGRIKLYKLCFALDFSLDKVVWFFSHVCYDKAFNCHCIYAAVYYYAFQNHLTFSDALSIINQIEGVDLPDNSTSAIDSSMKNYTRALQNQIDNIKSNQELIHFLIEEKRNFNIWNVSACQLLEGLTHEISGSNANIEIPKLKENLTSSHSFDISTAIHSDRYGLLLKDLFIRANNGIDSNPCTYILDELYGEDKIKPSYILRYIICESEHPGLKNLLNSNASMLIARNFPNKQLMGKLTSKNISSQSYDTIRKFIILLDFFVFWVNIEIEEYAESQETSSKKSFDRSSEQIEQYYARYEISINTQLYNCCYEPMFAGNPYDLLFLCAAHSNDPLSFLKDCIPEVE